MPATGVDFRKTVSCVGKRCEFLAALLLLAFLLLLTGCKGGGGNGATTQASNAVLDSPWAFGFNSSSSGISGSSTNALVVNANLRLSSQVQSTSMIVIRACVRPSFSSESISGSVSGSSVSLMLAFGGVTMLLTGTLSADGSSMSGTYTMSGACGNDTGTWRGNRVLPINGPYIGFLVGTNSATVLNASISGNLVSSSDGAVTGTFSINSTCFKGNLNVTGTQTGLQFGGTGTDNLGDTIEFASASSDLGFMSLTGGIQVDTGPCAGDFAELTLATQNNGNGGGPGTNGVPIITALSPSKVAGFIVSVTVYGTNFTNNSQVLVDGTPVLTGYLPTSGTLTASMNVGIGPGTHLFSVRDVGGTSNSVPYTVYVPGIGPQPFLSPVSLTQTNVNLMSVADVNGDTIPDLFLAGAVPGSIAGTTFLGNGDGSFQPGVNTPPGGLLIADLNHDGLADLIGTDGTNLLVWPGTGDPHFSSSPITVGPVSNTLVSPFPTIKVADIDGDGNPDIVVAGTIYFGHGNFQFDVVQIPFTAPFVIGDFNNDGKLDIMAGTTFLNQGNRTFKSVSSGASLGASPVSLVIGDFNKDGLLDVASLDDYFTTVWVNYGRGDGTFSLQGAFNVPTGLGRGMVAGDFNGDGLPDIVVGSALSSSGSGQIMLLTNDSQGGFLLSYFASGNGTVGLVTSDFNKDGQPDIAVLSNSGNPLVMLHK